MQNKIRFLRWFSFFVSFSACFVSGSVVRWCFYQRGEKNDAKYEGKARAPVTLAYPTDKSAGRTWKLLGRGNLCRWPPVSYRPTYRRSGPGSISNSAFLLSEKKTYVRMPPYFCVNFDDSRGNPIIKRYFLFNIPREVVKSRQILMVVFTDVASDKRARLSAFLAH